MSYNGRYRSHEVRRQTLNMDLEKRIYVGVVVVFIALVTFVLAIFYLIAGLVLTLQGKALPLISVASLPMVYISAETVFLFLPRPAAPPKP